MPTAGLPLLSSLALALAGLAPGCEEGGGAALRVAEPRVDFGVVREGEVLEHAFRVEVRRPASVSAVRTDCGCTVARLELERGGVARPYEPGTALLRGDVLAVSARYDTLGRSGASARAIHLALPEGVLDLALAADVRPWLRCEPPAPAFTRVRQGQRAETALRVLSLSGEPFGLRATGRALPPWVALELLPEGPTPDGRAPVWRLRAELGSEAPRGLFSYALELETDVPIPARAPDSPVRRFALAPVWSLQVVGPVALSRPDLEFGLVAAREAVARSLRVEGFDAAFRPGAVRARLEPVRAGEPFPLARTAQVHLRPGAGACEVEVVLDGLDPEVRGTFLGRLVVETGHAELPELEALVRGTRAPEEGRP
ncbi:MAG TPA: hypothetical protein VF530_08525 [Planctomycetota bacterium]